MYTGKPVFAQVMDHLPMHTLRRHIDRCNGHRFVKSFSCQDQFRSMAFAQLTSSESFRDIEACPGVRNRGNSFTWDFEATSFGAHLPKPMKNVTGASMPILRNPRVSICRTRSNKAV